MALKTKAVLSFVLLASVMAGFFLSLTNSHAQNPQSLPAHPLIIETQEGRSVQFTAELAKTGEERAIGLMFRKSMPQNHSMLFVYEEPDHLSFWMSNTYIPLDMLFINTRGKIVYIHENAVPHSKDIITTRQRAIAALEINAGLAAKYNIQVGDRIRHPLFKNHNASKKNLPKTE